MIKRSSQQFFLTVLCFFLFIAIELGVSAEVPSTLITPIGPPLPPDQPTSGPGGTEYKHMGVKIQKYGIGVYQYWIFEPSNPTPVSAPLIIFNHGWSAMYPFFYQAWINHLVKRGNIVVFPRYQQGLYFGFQHFSSNAIVAVKNAINELLHGNHVIPELNQYAIVGHSLGGSITADMAALALAKGLPIPKAIMTVQPVSSRSNLSLIPSDTLMLVVVGQDDVVVGSTGGKSIFYNADQISLDNKDFVIQVSDRYGEPDLIASHFAPLSPKYTLGMYDAVDAMDYYSTWKLFDGLLDYAFYGIHKEFCLGNTPEQKFMGVWSDGTPVNELIVTDTP